MLCRHMCQLFAITCNTPTAVTFSFSGLAARGGRTGDPVHGFGLAFHDGPACRLFIDDEPAARSVLADWLSRHPIRARTVVAHVRRATEGAAGAERSWANCPPFVREWQGRHWSFAHDGDLQGFHPRLTGSVLPVGQTDSERAFCWLMQQLRRRIRTRREPAWQQTAPLIAEMAERLSRHGRFNVLLSDGEALYAHCTTRLHVLQREHPFPVPQRVDEELTVDLSVANGPGDRMVLVATEPLTRNEAWEPMLPGELRVFVAGEEVWRRAPRLSSDLMPGPVMQPRTPASRPAA
jgi:glutamine amidotransferase